MADTPDIVEEVARDILRAKGCSIVADEGWAGTIAHHRQMIERYGDVYANSRSLIHDALRDAKTAVTSYERLRRTAPAGEVVGSGVAEDSAAPQVQNGVPKAATWTAEALVTAWQDVFLGIEAHIKDRMEMGDQASPETYLEIIRADVADVQRRSQQIVAARWADNQRYQDRIKALETPPDDPAALIRIAEKAAAEWLMSDDTAYELSPEDAYRVAREMLRVANEAYQGVRLISVASEGQA